MSFSHGHQPLPPAPYPLMAECKTTESSLPQRFMSGHPLLHNPERGWLCTLPLISPSTPDFCIFLNGLTRLWPSPQGGLCPLLTVSSSQSLLTTFARHNSTEKHNNNNKLYLWVAALMPSSLDGLCDIFSAYLNTATGSGGPRIHGARSSRDVAILSDEKLTANIKSDEPAVLWKGKKLHIRTL